MPTDLHARIELVAPSASHHPQMRHSAVALPHVPPSSAATEPGYDQPGSPAAVGSCAMVEVVTIEPAKAPSRSPSNAHKGYEKG